MSGERGRGGRGRRSSRQQRQAGVKRREWRPLAQAVLALLVVVSMIAFYVLAFR